MRYLLSLTLAAIAALSVAGCATPAPTASNYTIAQVSGGPNCRRLAQPGDTKFQIYCTVDSERIWAGHPRSSDRTAGDTTCRRLAEPAGKRVETYCATTTQWGEFDARAVNEGVTCRWLGSSRRLSPIPQELCLTAPQWQIAEANLAAYRASPGVADAGSNWPGNGIPQPTSPAYATSYGYFPAGGAIGSQ